MESFGEIAKSAKNPKTRFALFKSAAFFEKSFLSKKEEFFCGRFLELKFIAPIFFELEFLADFFSSKFFESDFSARNSFDFLPSEISSAPKKMSSEQNKSWQSETISPSIMLASTGIDMKTSGMYFRAFERKFFSAFLSREKASSCKENRVMPFCEKVLS